MSQGRVGIWFIGVRGGVATTTILGLVALRRGLIGTSGLVSALPKFAELGLREWSDWVVGGHEIRSTTLRDEAMQLADTSRAVDRDLVRQIADDLDQIDANVRPGVLVNVGNTIEKLADDSLRQVVETPAEAVARIQSDLKAFAAEHDLERVIVVNVASTEPAPDLSGLPSTWNELKPRLADAACPISASSIYAIAALDLAFPFVNFTPSPGSNHPAIEDLAAQRKTCHMGHDGKTGETLLKSALAPMFAARNLEIMSWVGHNIFGNLDGVVLNDPENKSTKVKSKDRLLGEILGYNPQTHISIEYIKSLGDWKTAWDHIHFRGFLGTPMIMTFTWQGCDSILAAPLVLDLVRFTERAARDGEVGLLTWLASFFKSPLGVAENDFVRQVQMLEERWSDEASE